MGYTSVQSAVSPRLALGCRTRTMGEVDLAQMAEGLFFRGGRAARVVRALLEVDASLDHDWEGLCRSSGFGVEYKNDTWGVLITALEPPDADDALLLRIFGHECRPKDSAATAHWRISAGPSPSTISPKIQRDTDRFAGGSGWLTALGDMWPIHEKLEWSFEIDYALDQERWEPCFGHHRLFDRVESSAGIFWTDYVAWTAQGHPRISKILLVPEHESSNLVALSIKGSIKLDIGPDMLRELDKSAWQDILPLLTPGRQS